MSKAHWASLIHRPGRARWGHSAIWPCSWTLVTKRGPTLSREAVCRGPRGLGRDSWGVSLLRHFHRLCGSVSASEKRGWWQPHTPFLKHHLARIRCRYHCYVKSTKVAGIPFVTEDKHRGSFVCVYSCMRANMFILFCRIHIFAYRHLYFLASEPF